MPTNTTPDTAIDITGRLPYSLTQDQQGVATGSFVPSCVDAQLPGWWKYTTGASESVFGVRAVSTGDYQAGVSVWTGTIPALTELSGGCDYSGQDSWLVVRGQPSTTYYIQVSTDTPGAVTSPLTFSAVAAPNVDAPAGSLYIMEDNDVGVPGVIIDQTDGSIIRVVSTAPCEFGAVMPPGGVVCIAAAVPGELYLESIKLFDNQLLTEIADLPGLVAANQSWLSPVTQDFAGTFYIIQIPRAEVPLTSAVVVVTVSDTGVAGPTYTLPTNLGQINGAAVSRDGTILYYTTQATGDQRIRRHDLTSDTPLSDFATFSTRVWKYDLAVLPNGDLLSAYHLSASSTIMRVDRHSSAGVLQATYTVGASSGNVPRMALALDDLSFWAMTFSNAFGVGPLNDFQRIVVSDASVATSFSVRNQNNPFLEPGEFFTPTTCPLLVLQQDVAPYDQPDEPPDITVVETPECERTTEQQITITGTNFCLDAVVTATDPDGNVYTPTIISNTTTEIVVSLIVLLCGEWTFTVTCDTGTDEHTVTSVDSCVTAPVSVACWTPGTPSVGCATPATPSAVCWTAYDPDVDKIGLIGN